MSIKVFLYFIPVLLSVSACDWNRNDLAFYGLPTNVEEIIFQHNNDFYYKENDITKTGPQNFKTLQNKNFLTEKDRLNYSKHENSITELKPEIKNGQFVNQEYERTFRNKMFYKKFGTMPNYANWAVSMSPEERDELFLKYNTIDDYLADQEKEKFINDYINKHGLSQEGGRRLAENQWNRILRKDTQVAKEIAESADAETPILTTKAAQNYKHITCKSQISDYTYLYEYFGFQIAWLIVAGIALVILMGWYFATYDSDGWTDDNWPVRKHLLKRIGAIIDFIGAAVIAIILLVNKDDYEETTILYMLYFSIVLVIIGCYVIRFKPSPRSTWIKIRKVVAYYLILVMYDHIAMRFIPVLGMASVGELSGAYALGRFLSIVFWCVIVYFLLRHYKNEKYIPYKKAIRSNNAISIIDRPKIALSYYIGYVLLICVLVFLDLVTDDELELFQYDDNTRNTIFGIILLLIIPLGIYYILRLRKNADNQ